MEKVQVKESIWKTRWKLFLKSAKQNWGLFKERKIAIFGLVVIILFGIFGALHPLYVKLMGDRYTGQLIMISRLMYDAYDEKAGRAFRESTDEIDYTLKFQKVQSEIDRRIDEIFRGRGMLDQNTFRSSVEDVILSYFDFESRKAMVEYIKSAIGSSKSVDEAAEKIARYFYLKKIDSFINDVGTYEKSRIVWEFLNEERLRENLERLAKENPEAFVSLLSFYRIYYRPSEIADKAESAMETLMAKAKLDVFPLLSNPDVLEGVVDTESLEKALSDPQVLYYISLVYELGMSMEEIEQSARELAQAFAESPDFDTYSQVILKKRITEMFTEGREKLRSFLEEIAKGHIKYEITKDFDFNYIAKDGAMKNTLEFFDEKFPQLVGLWRLIEEAEKALEQGNNEKAEEALMELSRRLSNLSRLKRSVTIISFWVDSLEGGNCGYKDGRQRIGLNFRNIDQKLAPYVAGEVDEIFKQDGGKLRMVAQKIQDTLASSKKASTEREFQEMARLAEKSATLASKGLKPDLSKLKEMLKKYYLSEKEDEELRKTLEHVRSTLEDAAKRVIVYDLHYLAEYFMGKIESYLGKGEMLQEIEKQDALFKDILKGGRVGDIEEILRSFNDLVQRLTVEVASLDLSKIKLTPYYSELTSSLVEVYDQYLSSIKEVLEEEGLRADDSTVSKVIRAAALIELEETAKAYYFSSRPYDPVTGNDGLLSNPAPPSMTHPFGTDPLGRDILGQMMYSTPREFVLGVTAAFITVFIGTIIGATSAYYGGVVDTFFMRLADIIMLFPSLPLLMVLSAFMELTLFKLALIIGIISGFGSITIVLKAQALTVKVRPFIEAAKSAGASDWYIIRRHIIPNILPLSFLYMMFSVTGAIFTEAVLSFFGLVNIRMSWGIILYTASSQGYLMGTNIGTFWWLWVPAGVAITLICSAFYFLGRGLEEIVNPRLRKR